MTSLSGRKIGFIGLGFMGGHMSRHIMDVGADMIIYARSADKVKHLTDARMTLVGSPKEVAEQAETTIICVSNTDAVEAVLLGDNGVLAGVSAGKLVIDMGTTAVTRTKDFAKAVMDKGCEYIDAPISGGAVGAKEGSLTIMAGGSDEMIERARPLFEAMGSRLTHIGGIGTGQVAKSANQVIVGLTIGAISEALYLAKRAGADPAKVRDAFKGGFADSRIMDLHGQRIISNDFTPGGTCVTQRKDMAEACALAAELGFELPASALNGRLFEEVIEAGLGGIDHAGLYKYYDRD
jgi:3-hydroxyisobutyrate dehydrogenase-like beta-hydroxyacid dehydrogenase